MKSAFITNSEGGKLADRLSALIGTSDRFDMLVGYFYYSAISAISDSLRQNEGCRIRVLVGLEAEQGTVAAINEGLLESEVDEESARTIREAYYRDVEKTLMDPRLDKRAFFERLDHVIEWIRTERMEIRKTRRPNHAKLYIFQMDESHRPLCERMFITGSSNFSEPGLSMRDEFNVELKDFGTEEAQRYYDGLWEEAVPLTETEEQRGRLIEILENVSTVVTPFEAYMRVLREYIGYQESMLNTTRVNALLKRAGYSRFQYQIDAVAQAMRKVDDYGGVIIADVVGLGKSVIGSLLGALRDKRGMVICPPGLVGDESGEGGGWNEYLKSFGLDEIGWKAMSRGDLGKIRETMKRGNYGVVVVDEAHYFRNRISSQYEELHGICAGREVILLTATPFNNRPNDLLALLLLFSGAKDSPFVKSGNIEDEFADMDSQFKALGNLQKLISAGCDIEAIAVAAEACGITRAAAGGGTSVDEYRRLLVERRKTLSDSLRAVMEKAVIRRNRIDIRENKTYSREVGEISQVCPPQAQHFELTADQNDFYDRVIREYFSDEGGARHFHGAVYRPDHYMKTGGAGEYQENVYKMLRMRLVLRFESSFGAFRQSIENVLKMIELTKEFIEKSNGVIYYNKKIMETILDLPEGEDVCAELDRLITEDQAEIAKSGKRGANRKAEYNLYASDFDGKRYMSDLDEDIALLRQILKEVDGLGLASNDPKVDALVGAIRKVLSEKHGDVEVREGEPKRKVIVFTSFTDTMVHAEKFLKKAFPGRVLAVSAENYGKKMAETIRANFDASVVHVDQKDDYDILLATDKLSEGFNLNRAGLVVNYDIPWNPTRVIQRVGRINRIGKMVFRNLYIFNFFPTVKGATVAQNREIAQNKMFAIHGILGEDAQIFSLDEVPTAAGLFKKLCSLDDDEELSFYAKAKNAYVEGMEFLEKNYPEMARRLKRDKPRVKTAFKRVPGVTFMFARRGASLFASYYNPADGSIQDCPLQDAIEGIACEFDTKKVPFGNDFWGSRDPVTGKQRMGVYERMQGEMQTSASNGKARITNAYLAAKNLENHLLDFEYEEQSFVEDMIFDLRFVGSLTKQIQKQLSNQDIPFEELRALVQGVAARFGEGFFKEKRASSSGLKIIATIQRV